MRTKKSVYFISPDAAGKAVASASTPAPAADRSQPPQVKARPGWRLINHAGARFLIQIPAGWHDEGIRRLGKKGHMVPFVRKQKVWGRVIHQGTVHLFSSSSRGKEARGVWDYVLARRKARSPGLRLVKVRDVPNAGGSGVSGISAIYWVNGPRGGMVEERSLIVVKGKTAYVLTGTVAPYQKPHIWAEIDGIFRALRPY